MAKIKLDDQTICQSTTLEISSVIVSSNAPYGYDSLTKVLRISDNSLALTGSPIWDNETGNDTKFLSFAQVNGSVNTYVKRVHARGTTDQQSQSFQDNGVGLEIIHSTETSNILPLTPSAIDNALGFTGRKYQNYQYYLWFDDLVGKITYWWDVQAAQWKKVLQGTNVLVVNGEGGGDFTKLTDAYTYLTGLAVPPSASNIWTVLIYNRVSETTVVNAHDFINVVFMPGGQLYVNANSSTSVRFSGSASAPVRYTAGVFSALWSSVEKSSITGLTSTSGNGRPYFHIIGVLNDALATPQSVIEINAMKDIALHGLSVYLDNGTSTFRSGYVVKITGACVNSFDLSQKNVILKDMTLIAGSNQILGQRQYGVFTEHSSGNIYIDDCMISSDLDNLSAVTGIDIFSSGTTYLNECMVLTSIKSGSYAINIRGATTLVAGSRVFATNCVFESYTDTTTGYGSAAARIEANAQFSKCTFRFRGNVAAGGNPLTSGLAASSAAVWALVRDTQQVKFHECLLFADAGTACGLSIQNNGTWADTKLILNKCSVYGPLASVASQTGTTGTTKKFYGCSFEGPISGTPFGCAAATATLATNYRV
jgi:hypothetical protein